MLQNEALILAKTKTKIIYAHSSRILFSVFLSFLQSVTSLDDRKNIQTMTSIGVGKSAALNG
jgi:hypothetical protein